MPMTAYDNDWGAPYRRLYGGRRCADLSRPASPPRPQFCVDVLRLAEGHFGLHVAG
jgi:hypothetical protein